MTGKGQVQTEKKDWFLYCKGEDGSIPISSSSGWQDTIAKICSARDYDLISPLPEWQKAVTCGIVPDRSAYLSLLRDVSIGIVIRDLTDSCDTNELSLIHFVRILDEIDHTISRLSERMEDYYIALHPSELSGYERNVRALIDQIAKDSYHPLNTLAKNLLRIHDSRVILAGHIRTYGEKTIPNMTALCGPLVAARLLAKAGSKNHLACMPASSLQVFGAGPSLFTHLTAATNPPKHGIIYQYKGVHHAKRRNRGRVSRVLACQLAIAAKIDYYRGIRDEIFLKKAGFRICRAGQ